MLAFVMNWAVRGKGARIISAEKVNAIEYRRTPTIHILHPV